MDNNKLEIESNNLTAEEKAAVAQIQNTIKLNDATSIVQFGASLQKKASTFADKALHSINNTDLGEMEGLLQNLLSELQDFSVNEKKGIFGKIGKAENLSPEKLRRKFKTTLSDIEHITQILEAHRIQLLTDINMLEDLYELSAEQVQLFTICLVAGKQWLESAKLQALEEIEDKSDLHTAQDVESKLNRFEKRLYDLDITRISTSQFCAQLSLVQENLLAMSEQIHKTLVDVIPIWKNRMLLVFGMDALADAAKSQNITNALTNRMLKESEKKLHSISKRAAQESEQTVVDVETVASLNQELIETITRTFDINKKANAERRELENVLSVLGSN